MRGLGSDLCSFNFKILYGLLLVSKHKFDHILPLSPIVSDRRKRILRMLFSVATTTRGLEKIY